MKGSEFKFLAMSMLLSGFVFDNLLCCSFSVLSRCECYVYLTNYSDKYIKNLFTFVQEKLILLLT